MKKFLLFVLLLCANYVLAQDIEVVYSRDGSEYRGYISEQVPGKWICVYSDSASLVLQMSKVENLRVEYRRYSSLPVKAQKYFREYDDTTYIKLCSFEYEGVYYDNLYKRSSDANSLYVLSFNPQTYKILWKDLVRDVKYEYADVPYGIRDILLLRTGERYVGQIIEQNIGKNIVFKTVDGDVHRVSDTDILSIRSEKIGDEDLFSQIELLDRLILKDGTSVIGFIESRVMGGKIALVTDGSGAIRNIDISDISIYQKLLNKDYVPYIYDYDTIRSIKMNGSEVLTTDVYEYKGYTYLSDSLMYSIRKGESITFVLHNYVIDNAVELYSLKRKKYKGTEDALRDCTTYRFNEGSKNLMEVFALENVNEDLVFKFKMSKPGVYVLRLDSENMVVLKVE